VVAKYRNDDEWLFGTVERVNGDGKSYNIAYDDKDKMEFGVLSERIRKAPDNKVELGPEQQEQIKREIAEIEAKEIKQQERLDRHRAKMEKLKSDKALLRKRQSDLKQTRFAAESTDRANATDEEPAEEPATPKATGHNKMHIRHSMSLASITPDALLSQKRGLNRQNTIDRSTFKSSTPTQNSTKLFKFKLELQRQVAKDFDPKDPNTLIPANMTRQKPPLGKGRKATVSKYALKEQQTIFEEGTTVEAMFRGRDNNWLTATVIRCNNNGFKLSYNIEYEDAGKKEFGVPPEFVRRIDGRESARSSIAGHESVVSELDEVAVKEFARFPSEEDLVIFKREYEVLKALNKIDSPHLVKMLSACLPDTSPPAICLELCEMGNLDTLLKRDISVPPCVRLELVLGVAKGLESMHGAGWAHLDLKEHNVMVCHSMDEAAEQSRRPRLLAKLCDFGSALYLPEPAVLTLPEDDMGIRYGCGTAGWAAPELLDTLEGNNPVVGVSADVFSFAMIMWRSLVMDVRLPSTTDESPRRRLQNPLQGVAGEDAMELLAAGVRPLWPDHSPDPSVEDLGYLLADMWATDPAARPTAASTVPALTKLLMGSSRWALMDDGYETPRDPETGEKEHHVSHSKSRSRATPQYSTPNFVSVIRKEIMASRALGIDFG
jgi:serine/threonine protein kinase